MNKNKLKEDILKNILSLNSDISNHDRNRLINLLNSIVDYTGNSDLEQTITELSAKVESLKQRIEQLENSSQS